MDPVNDDQLIRAIQGGDRSAFEILYERHKAWVISLARRYCGNHDDALDVLQETFAYFFRRLPGFELRSRFRTFLFPVVKHLALTRRRTARREMPSDQVPEPAEEPAGGSARDLVASLPEEQREVVWLRFVDGFDLKEIAEVPDIPIGTVKSRLHAALNALRGRGSETGFPV